MTAHGGAKWCEGPSRRNRRSVTASRLDALFAELYEHYGQASAWRLHDDTRENLHRLSGRFRLLVLSNFDRRLRRILEGLDIAQISSST